MNIRSFIIYTLWSMISIIPCYAQNVPVTTGLPSGSMNGIITYPPNLHSSPNTTPTFYNYQRDYVPLVPMSSIPSFDNTSSLPVLVNTTYRDGLGNNLMQISRTNAHDIVTPFYNRVSKTSVAFLPYYIGHHQKFLTNVYSAQNTQYLSMYPAECSTATSTAYAKTVKDIDPITGLTVVNSYAPGGAFVGQERGTTATTAIHPGNEIFILEYNGYALCKNGYYTAGSLSEKIEKSQHTEVVTYYDKSSRVVCKKTYLQNKTVKQYTYYVYNDMGKLIYIVPPKAAQIFLTNNCLTTTEEEQLCYSYLYDEYGNTMIKGTPGKDGKEYIVYDRLRRPVLVQNPKLAALNKWAFTLYDNRGRVTMSGLYSAGSDDRGALQDYIRNQAAYVTANMAGSLLYYMVNYMGSSYPGSIANCEINSINYYDDYTTGPASHTSYDNSYNTEFLTGGTYETPVPYYFANGKPVATQQRIVNDNNYSNDFVNPWITSVFYYDEKGRVIQTKTLNPWNDLSSGANLPGHWDVTAQQYDFTGNVVYSVTKHHLPRANKAATEIRTKSIYNPLTGRLEEVKMQMDTEPWQTLQQYTYDQMGRVKKKWIGGTEEQHYSYHISGKRLGINENYIKNPQAPWVPTVTYAELVSFEQGFSDRRFDGSLSGFQWRTLGGNVSAYGYGYDDMGRMTKADFREYLGTTTGWSKTQKDFSVSDITYDANGNMETMKQYGYDPSYNPTLIDDLTYTYHANSNRLASVTDDGFESPIHDFDNSNATTANYEYDEDGNLAEDDLKDLALEYNHQDLPLMVSKNATGDFIENIYDGGGVLLGKNIRDGGTTDRYFYWGPFVYRNDSLLYLQHGEGRCRWVNDTGVFRYDYFIKDHLGNVRTAVTTDAQSLSTYYLATHEVASANIEELIFENIADVRSVNPVYSTGNFDAILLNGGDPNARIGTSLLLQVMAGDKVNLQAYSYHEGKEGEDDFAVGEEMFNSLISVLAEGSGGFSGEGELGEDEKAAMMTNIFSQDNFATYEALKSNNTDPDLPRAYLNYLFFDDAFTLIADQSRVIQVSGNVNSWELLGTPDVPVEQSGHLLIYLSNEQAMNVHFDNMAVTYTKGRLIEENHYYPHGLLVKATAASGVFPENKDKYQGKRLQEELGMQLYDFHARQYDPQIGRFWGIDPMDEFPSGYTGMGNDPANLVDPSGMSVSMTGQGGFPTIYSPAHQNYKFRMANIFSKAFQEMLKAEHAADPGKVPISTIAPWSEGENEALARNERANLFFAMTVAAESAENNARYEAKSTGSKDMVTVNGQVMPKDQAEKQADDVNKVQEAQADVDQISEGVTDNKKVQVIIWDKEGGKGDVGHTAIKIGDKVYGYYPSDENGNGAYDMNELFGSKGEMHVNSQQEFNNLYSGNSVVSFDVKISGVQTQKLEAILTTVAQVPGTYSLTGNNCTSVAINALINSGLQIRANQSDGFAPRPIQNGYGFSPNALGYTLLMYNSNIFYNPNRFIVK